MKSSEGISDLRALGYGLAQAAVRRGARPSEAVRAISEALPSLLKGRRGMLDPLQEMLRHPACVALLGCPQPDQRRQLLQDLVAAQSAAAVSHGVAAQQAFLDGVLEGWLSRPSSAAAAFSASSAPVERAVTTTIDPPDLRAWLGGLAAGLVLGGIGGLFALLALRAMGLDLLGLAPPPSAVESVPALPSGAPSEWSLGPTASSLRSLSSDPPIPDQCARLALPTSEHVQLAAATNYDKRLHKDARGAAIPSQPSLIVLHETVLDLPSTLALFQRNNADDAAQGSYHILIARDGQRVRIVPDQARAFGAGDSGFGDLRFETSATNPPSINNVALHVSLETPSDGRGEAEAHAGYTTAQYRSLAAQVLRWQALYGIPMDRVTTHAAVDRSHSRYDPRSFRWERFDQAYNALRRSCA